MVFKIAPISLVGLTIQKTSDTQTQLLCTSSQSDLFQTKISTLGVQSQSFFSINLNAQNMNGITHFELSLVTQPITLHVYFRFQSLQR